VEAQLQKLANRTKEIEAYEPFVAERGTNPSSDEVWRQVKKNVLNEVTQELNTLSTNVMLFASRLYYFRK
jgi:hypothetical protein